VHLHYISQDSGVVRINLVPLIIFGNGGLGESLGKWWTQMHKEAGYVQIKCFSIFNFSFLGIKWCRMLNI